MTQRPAARPVDRTVRGARFRPDPSQALAPDARSLARFVTALALAAALAAALVPPGGYLLAEYAYAAGSLEARARSLADRLAQRGGMLNTAASEPSLRRLLQSEEGERWPEGQRILRSDGTVLLTSAPEAAPPAPLLRRRASVPAEGQAAWQVEVSHSLRPMLVGAALLLLPCAGLGLLAFLLLRLLPVRALTEALHRATHSADHDALTGLPARAAFHHGLRQDLQARQRDGRGLAVLLIDLNHFKPLNDALGHASGDALLVAVAQRLSGAMRPGTTLFRLGGDVFAALQPGTRAEAGAELAGRLLAQLATPFMLGRQSVEIGASIGIAFAPPSEPGTPDGLLQQADIALDRAKQQGCSGFCLFAPEMDRPLLEQRALERDLRRALVEGQFRLEYQPLVCLASGRVLGAEALLRWHRPGHGDIPPDRFIGLAEETGLIGPIGAWVLQEACREAARWPGALGIAVNVSPLQFRLPGLCGTVRAALEQAGLAPDRLELEITEGVLLRDTPELLGVLRDLRGLGVRLAMDDFGTGYSSLGYLSRFAFDKIKIDRSFVQQLAHDPKSKAVIRAVMGISQTLGIRANAEGVESREQAELLRQEGCAEVQGYLYGRPMPPEQFAALCRQAA